MIHIKNKTFLKKKKVLLAFGFVVTCALSGCTFNTFKPGKPSDPHTPTTNGIITGEKGVLEYQF